MSDFDNTVILYDEDGNEIEFEIVHFCEYKGETYYVLWGEDDNEEDIFIVTKKDADDDHEVVHDDEVIAFVQKSFKEGMNDFMDEVDAYAVESDFMSELNSILEGESDDIGAKAQSKEMSMPMDAAVRIAPFDSEKYLQQSQDFLFVEANSAYGKADYDRALSAFSKADEQGNIYAAAHLGMMHYYGYGCQQDRDAAFEFFKRGAEYGCPLAAAWVSECYRLGHGVEKDKERAKKIYNSVDSDLRRMCDAGDMAALYFLGFNLVMGTGVEENEEEGVRLLTQAYEKGEIRAAVQLAECYYNGWGVAENPKKTVELLMKHPMPSNKKAQYLLGLCNFYGEGVEKNLNRAFLHFKAAANLGHARAKDYLAGCYYHGHGTEKNFAEAARWFKDAADNHGIARSADMLGYMYLDGEGVEADEKEAIHYFLIAADGGIVETQKMIAREYFNGYFFENRVLEQDANKARQWMEKAATKGDAEAQIMLGTYYVSDRGFDDETKAFEWFMKAAEQGEAEAEYMVGGCYKHGIGVPVDTNKGNEWLKKAAEHGSDRAKHELGIK